MGSEERPPKSRHRRRVLQGIATGLAGAVGASAEGAPPTLQDRSGSTSPAAAPEPVHFLNESDRQTLDQLADLLVPGAIDAEVPDLLDRVLAVEASETQQSFLTALRAFDGEARKRHGARLVELDGARRLAIVRDASEDAELRDKLVELRDRIARTFFATEPGMRALGWTRRSAWRELPECSHPTDDHR